MGSECSFPLGKIWENVGDLLLNYNAFRNAVIAGIVHIEELQETNFFQEMDDSFVILMESMDDD